MGSGYGWEELEQAEIDEASPEHEQHLTPGKHTLTDGHRRQMPLSPGKRTLTGHIRRKPAAAGAISDAAGDAVAAAQSSAGRPLPSQLRDDLEGAVGTPLDDVRVHTGSASDEAARSIDARAYTHGRDIHFASGTYQPDSHDGRQLIAHEVAHTAQGGGTASATPELGAVDDPAEAEADRFAGAFARGEQPDRPVQASPGIGRQVIRREVRMPEDHIEGTPPDKALSADDRARLENAQHMLTKAKQTLSSIQRAINNFNSNGASSLSSVGATFRSTTGMYDAAYQSHKLLVQRVAEYAAIEEAMLGILVSAAMNFIIPGAGAFLGTVEGASGALEAGVTALSSMADFARGKALAPVTGGVNRALGLGGVGAALDQPWANKLDFYKEFQKAWKKQATIMPFAGHIGSGLAAVAKVKTKVDLMLNNGKTLKESPKALEREAAFAADGARQCDGAQSQLKKAVSEAEKMAQAATATKPQSQDAVEREIWIKWLSQLPNDNLDTMDRDRIENKLRRLDIWSRLGIDIGDWFSDNEQLKAKASARAVEMILAHRGQELRVPNAHDFHHTSMGGDLSDVTYKVDQSSTYFGTDGRGFVFDARAFGDIGDDILWEVKGIDAGAKKLIRDGKIVALVRTTEEWEKPKKDEDKEAEPADVKFEPDKIKADAPKNETLSAKDRELLANAKKMLDRADANLGKVEGGLATFSGQSLGDLQAVENVFQRTCNLYEIARHEQEMTLRSAGQIGAVQQDLVKMLVGGAFANLKFSDDMKETFEQTSKWAVKGFEVLEEAFGTAKEKSMSEPVSEKMNANMAATVPGGGPDWARQLAFHQQMSEIYQAASGLARLQGHTTGARGPLTELRTEVDMMLKNGETLRLSPADIDKKAARAQNGANQLGGASSSIETSISRAAALRASAEGSAPQSEQEVLRELWIKWLSSLDLEGLDAMDQDKIENKLRKLGIWSQLGIDIGSYFSDNDQLKAHAVARAVDMLSSRRGSEVHVPSTEGHHQLSLGGELSRVTYRVAKDSPYQGKDARGYIVSAEAAGEIGDDILWSVRGVDAGARKLIRDGNVIAVVRAVAKWDQKEGESE